MDISNIVNILFIALLIALTAFFVASEFAAVKVRSSRIDQLVQENVRGAKSAKKVISNLDEYLSACQLGITLTSLLLGWIGEPAIHHMLEPLFAKTGLTDSQASFISFLIAFSSITFLHVVIGELAPKTIAIQRAEQVVLLLSGPLILFYKIMYPFIWVLNNSARVITRLLGFKEISESEEAHSEEELKMIIEDSFESGEINENEMEYVQNVFEFDDRIAKEIMVPRTEMVALDVNMQPDEFLEIFKEQNFTRYPIIDGDKDNIIGMVNVKEVLLDVAVKKSFVSIREYIRPITRDINSTAIGELLRRMQHERVQMVVLMDEYGGTSGLVTAEDILEEIVGEIRDEFDHDETNDIEKIADNKYLVDAKVLIEEINELLETDISDEEINTIGGWVMDENYDVKIGDVVEHKHIAFEIKEMDNHKILSLEITVNEEVKELSEDEEVSQASSRD